MRIYRILMKLYTQSSKTLNLKKIYLPNKGDDSYKCLLKLTKGQEKINKLLDSQCMPCTT